MCTKNLLVPLLWERTWTLQPSGYGLSGPQTRTSRLGRWELLWKGTVHGVSWTGHA